MSNFMTAIIGVATIFLIVILTSLFFIKLGWSLFVVPVFGLPELTWMQALGFSFLAAAFKPSSFKSESK